MNRTFHCAAWLLLCAFVLACSASNQNAATPAEPSGKFTLSSAAFESGGVIPRQFSCEGSDISPALKWNDPPVGTESFALIVDDPDAPAGTWVHWVLYNLPATARELPEAMAKDAELPGGACHGRNDFRRLGYGGPCPPPGPAHHYHFKLYALDRKLDLKPGATKAEVEEAMAGHILAKAELIGLYRR
jgi:Raf kinase inhibitor-like YbhB/YbcL family protein